MYNFDPYTDNFEVVTPGDADRAISIIKRQEAERDQYIEAAKERTALLQQQIADAEAVCAEKTRPLLEQLDRWLETARHKETKTQWSASLPSGKLVRKLPRLDFDYDPEELLKYLKENDTDFIQTTSKPKWSEFKKLLQEDAKSGVVLRADTGEALEVIRLVEVPGKVEVK